MFRGSALPESFVPGGMPAVPHGQQAAACTEENSNLPRGKDQKPPERLPPQHSPQCSIGSSPERDDRNGGSPRRDIQDRDHGQIPDQVPKTRIAYISQHPAERRICSIHITMSLTYYLQMEFVNPKSKIPFDALSFAQGPQQVEGQNPKKSAVIAPAHHSLWRRWENQRDETTSWSNATDLSRHFVTP